MDAASAASQKKEFRTIAHSGGTIRVDPDNRLVADSLEAEWNSKLRALTETQQNRERQREQDRKVLSDQQRAAIFSLATDFPGCGVIQTRPTASANG